MKEKYHQKRNKEANNKVNRYTNNLYSKEGKEAYSSLCYKHHTATGTHMPHGITQYYLPPGRGDIPAITPSQLRLVLDLATPVPQSTMFLG